MSAKKVVLTRPTYTRAPVKRSAVPLNLGKDEESMTRDSGRHTLTTHTPLRGGVVCCSASIPEGGVESVVELVRKLNDVQKKELLALLALDATEQVSGSDDRDVRMWSEAVADELADVTHTSVGPLLVRKVLAPKASWAVVHELVTAAGRATPLTVQERQSMYCLLAGVLVNHANYVAKSSGAPLSAKLVGNCVVNLPGLLDDAFPGYLHAGLMPLVVRQFHANRTHR